MEAMAEDWNQSPSSTPRSLQELSILWATASPISQMGTTDLFYPPLNPIWLVCKLSVAEPNFYLCVQHYVQRSPDLGKGPLGMTEIQRDDGILIKHEELR